MIRSHSERSDGTIQQMRLEVRFCPETSRRASVSLQCFIQEAESLTLWTSDFIGLSEGSEGDLIIPLLLK